VSKWNEIRRERRNLRGEELNDLYSSQHMSENLEKS